MCSGETRSPPADMGPPQPTPVAASGRRASPRTRPARATRAPITASAARSPAPPASDAGPTGVGPTARDRIRPPPSTTAAASLVPPTSRASTAAGRSPPEHADGAGRSSPSAGLTGPMALDSPPASGDPERSPSPAHPGGEPPLVRRSARVDGTARDGPHRYPGARSRAADGGDVA